MPFDYRIHRDPDLHVIVYSGHVTLEDSRKLFRVAMNDPRHVPGMPALVDFRGMTETDLSFSDMLALRDGLAERIRGVPGTVRIAILTGSELTYGLGHMFASATREIEQVHVEMFPDLDAALAFHSLVATDVSTVTFADPGFAGGAGRDAP